MRKEEADLIKAEFYQEEAEDELKVTCLGFMSEEDMQGALAHLDCFGIWLENCISDFSLDCSHTLVDTEDEDLVRTYWFSKGMQDTFICLNPTFQIRGFDPEIPLQLIAQVADCLATVKEEIEQARKENHRKKWRTDGRQGFQED